MKKLLVLLLLLVCAAVRGELARPDLEMPITTWFDHIKSPLPLTTVQGLKLTVDVRKALLDNKSLEDIVALFPADSQPRAVFLTLGDGDWPSRTYFAVGDSLQDAVRKLLETLPARDQYYAGVAVDRLQVEIDKRKQQNLPIPASWNKKLQDPLDWNSLTLDIVQTCIPLKDYQIATSKILLTSIIGLAFDPQPGLAFTPAQLTGRSLVSHNHLLEPRAIGNLLADDGLISAMNNWLALSSDNAPKRLRLFEVDTFYADEQQTVRLFNGHPIQNRQEPPPPLTQAKRTAARLLECLQPDGQMQSPFTEWTPSDDNGGESLFARLELALALGRLAEESPDPKLVSALDNLLDNLLASLKYYGPGNQFACFVEEEPQSGPVQVETPRKLAYVRTNALALMVLEQAELAGAKARPQDALALLRHVGRQQLGEGNFLPVVILPKMQMPLENAVTLEGEIESNALAALAMLNYRHQDELFQARLAERAEVTAKYLLEKSLPGISSGTMPPLPWLLEFLTARKSPTPAEIAQTASLVLQWQSLATRQPLLPDFFGAPQPSESPSVAADITRATADMAALLRRLGQPQEARDFLADAWPSWKFQNQAWIDKPTANALPRPNHFLDFARATMRDFSFNLNIQTRQIFSLLNVHRELKAMSLLEFPCRPSDRQSMDNLWDCLDSHPLVLDPRLVINNAVEPPPDRRTSGTFGEATSTSMQLQNVRSAIVDHEMSSQVLKKKK